MARYTLSYSVKSPATIRTSLVRDDKKPTEAREVYRTNAVTRAPRATSASTTWLPMNPAAPVTRTLRPAQFIKRSRSRIPSGPDRVPYRHPDQLDIQPQALPSHIEKIVAELIPRMGIVSTKNLGDSREPGPD